MHNDSQIRKRILDVAEEHFFRLGFSKVTMNEIADELGMSKKTLYAFFPGKEDLLRAIVDRAQRILVEEIDRVVADGQRNFVDKLRSILQLGAVFYSRFSQTFLLDLQKNVPGVWKVCDEFRRERMKSNVISLIEQGIASGYFRSDVNPTVAMMIHYAAMQALATAEMLSSLPLSSEEVFATIHKVVFEGILTDEARQQSIHRSQNSQRKEIQYV